MSDSNKRIEDRQEGKTYSEVTLLIQEGFQLHHLSVLLVDFSRSGAQFVTGRNEHVHTGRTALIHTRAGPSAMKHVIASRISWVSERGGRVWFGCEFFALQTAEPLFP